MHHRNSRRNIVSIIPTWGDGSITVPSHLKRWLDACLDRVGFDYFAAAAPR
jgi:hypothetical protein